MVKLTNSRRCNRDHLRPTGSGRQSVDTRFGDREGCGCLQDGPHRLGTARPTFPSEPALARRPANRLGRRNRRVREALETPRHQQDDQHDDQDAAQSDAADPVVATAVVAVAATTEGEHDQDDQVELARQEGDPSS